MSLDRKKILLTGASGMLAADLIPRLKAERAELSLFDLKPKPSPNHSVEALDITNEAELRSAIRRVHPSWIVNCAAYTAVDLAEKDYNTAFAVNTAAVANLARVAKENSVPLLHLSTDYVFGAGSASKPILEDAAVNPCGIYGHSKRYGEDLLISILPKDHLLVRTSWLHGLNGPNFIDTMLKLGREQKSIKVVDDQTGSPTWSSWLADVLVRLMQRNARGVYHASSRGGITWFEFAREIFHQAGMQIKVNRQSTAELNRPAPRPPYSVLDVRKLEHILGETCISWQSGIAQHLNARGIEARLHV